VAETAGGYAPLNGAIGVMPVVADQSPEAKSFVERYRKINGGRAPSQEASLNYTAVWATVDAMKLAGTTTDATAIRAAFDKAVKSLPPNNNPHGLTGVDAHGGLVMGRAPVAVVEGGKIQIPDASVQKASN
jgi:branched-chain amino acid transport system substrate-binding protein